jgi:hypothetical protein
LNESESEQGTSKDDSTKDSDSLLFIGEDFPDIGDNSEKLTDDFGEMSQAGVKTSVRTDTEMISTGIKSTTTNESESITIRLRQLFCNTTFNNISIISCQLYCWKNRSTSRKPFAVCRCT